MKLPFSATKNWKEMNDTRTIDNDTLLGEICLQLSQGKKVRLRAKGNSMRPFIHGSKDILLLAPSDCLRKGDVVLARIYEKRYVIHRIIGIRGEKITLMGDSNIYGKEECSRSEIFGIVESVIHNGKACDFTSSSSHIMAIAWRMLLPIRRAKTKIINLIEKR